jgi:glycosyltransferase involved in cell wall biosynthesis
MLPKQQIKRLDLVERAVVSAKDQTMPRDLRNHEGISTGRAGIVESTLTVIPARDEEHGVGAVVKSLRSAGLRHVRVVDNASTDSTAAAARQAGAEVLFEPRIGYGRACWAGLQDLPPGVEWILFCDADGSDDLEQLAAFFDAAQRADLVLGYRVPLPDGRSALTATQRLGNALATTLIRLGWGFSYRDLGPFRLIRRTALEAIQMRDRSWGWTVEMQVRAVEKGLRIVELPVRSHPRQAGRSKISGTMSGSFLAGTTIIATLSKLFVRRWIS